MLKFLFTNVTLFLMISGYGSTHYSFILISGRIDNPHSDSVLVTDMNAEVRHIIRLGGKNIIKDTLRLNEGYYYLKEDREYTMVYLKPGYKLDLYIDANRMDESIRCKGKGSAENNYLAKKALLNKSLGKFNYYGYYGNLEEKSFLKLVDSLYSIKMSLFLKNKKRFDKNFAINESKVLEIERLYKLSEYEGTHRFITGNKNFAVSNEYPNPFVNLNSGDATMLMIPGYTSFLESYLFTITKAEIKGKDSLDYTLCYLLNVEKLIKDPGIRENLSIQTGKYRLSYTKQLEAVYLKLISMIKDEKVLKEIALNYQRLKRLEKGADSPGFKFSDIDGKEVTLESLKGHLVYIDIWATWCLPCIKELPSLKALQEVYKDKNIRFVSISMGDQLKDWEAMVKEKELGGIQLISMNSNDPFFTDYMVDGIPRCILIDPNGKIIDANVKRPSDPKLREELDKLL